MRFLRIVCTAFLACFFTLQPSEVAAYELGPLVDLLVKKGLITEQEAEDLRAELATEFAETPAGKLEVGHDVKQLQTKVDIRARYQFESTQKSGEEEKKERSRWRYRVKLGTFYKFTQGWSAGLQLETANASDSTNSNFGGYFDKDGDGVFLGQIYIDYSEAYNWADLVNVTVGKKKHPFLIDSAFWDSDINPEGFTQQLGWRFNSDDWLTLRAGQYLIDEEKETHGLSGDDWLFVAQAEYLRHLGRKSDLRIAPMILAESGGETYQDRAESGNTPSNENSINYFKDMTVVALPMELTWLWSEIPQTLSAMVGCNLEGDEAAFKEGSPYHPGSGIQPSSSDYFFYNIKYTFGNTKFFKDWAVGLEYRRLGGASLTPNLSDSDFGKNRLNQEGFILSGAYMLSDSIKLGGAWMYSSAIDKAWVSDVAGYENVNLLQFDLSAKF